MHLTEHMVKMRSKHSELHTITCLNVFGCGLTDVSIVKDMPAIEILALSVNNISSLDPFKHCKKLRELYLRKNNVSSFDELRYLQDLPDLQQLWLAENPCQIRSGANYRRLVLRILPKLLKLDDMVVSEEERAEATKVNEPDLIGPQDNEEISSQNTSIEDRLVGGANATRCCIDTEPLNEENCSIVDLRSQQQNQELCTPNIAMVGRSLIYEAAVSNQSAIKADCSYQSGGTMKSEELSDRPTETLKEKDHNLINLQDDDEIVSQDTSIKPGLFGGSDVTPPNEINLMDEAIICSQATIMANCRYQKYGPVKSKVSSDEHQTEAFNIDSGDSRSDNEPKQQRRRDENNSSNHGREQSIYSDCCSDGNHIKISRASQKPRRSARRSCQAIRLPLKQFNLKTTSNHNSDEVLKDVEETVEFQDRRSDYSSKTISIRVTEKMLDNNSSDGHEDFPNKRNQEFVQKRRSCQLEACSRHSCDYNGSGEQRSYNMSQQQHQHRLDGEYVLNAMKSLTKTLSYEELLEFDKYLQKQIDLNRL